MRTLPIGPEEAFVLSRVDGRTTEAELVYATGLSASRVAECLLRLERVGAIRFELARDPSIHPAVESAGYPSSSRLMRPALESGPHPGEPEPPAALYDPAELDEVVDLDLARKRKILDVFYRLDTANHYELLQVPETADKKTVKNAYFELVSAFHPDKYFGKKLGAFKPKLERVFTRLTEAHDVLTRNKSRSEYDEYLKTQRKNRDLERLMADEREQAAELDRVRRQIEEEARLEEVRAQSALRGVQPTPAVRPEPPLVSDPEARRRALARKLGRTPSAARPGAAPAGEPPREYVAQELKRRYEQRVSSVRQRQVQHYVDQADTCLRENNVVAAANALRIAASLAPDDQPLLRRLDEVQQRANGELANSYMEQAQYEEKSGRLVEAARSYELAARGKPSAQLYERIARCLMEAGSDLRKAGDYARRASNLAPTELSPRLTLARVYLAAGMRQSAITEFERASTLAPNDEEVKTWLKRVRRGEI